MQTHLPAQFLATDAGREADSILRACVHCGFCNATCPTYQVEGNELDSPRGRIYLLKNLFEGGEVSEVSRHHLDRCLVCRSCETTCPSGVDYHSLLAIGQATLEQQLPRPRSERIFRRLLAYTLSRRQLFTPLLRMGQRVRWLLPARVREQVPAKRAALRVVRSDHARRVILVQGCVQPGLSPNTRRAAMRVLERLGITALTVAAEGCCGALNYHLHAQAAGLDHARANIDAWWPHIEAGVEGIVMTASGCSSFVHHYGKLLAGDPAYAEKAGRVVELLRDISEVLVAEDLSALALQGTGATALHCPCTAQHGQQLEGPMREVLERLGYELPAVSDSHLCCGSAGSYALFNPQLAAELRQRKLAALQVSGPQQILTANIGCQQHLSAASEVPVLHWIEAVAADLDAAGQRG
jgi:glycolate oxidase iron-sulfur subunit